MRNPALNLANENTKDTVARDMIHKAAGADGETYFRRQASIHRSLGRHFDAACYKRAAQMLAKAKRAQGAS